MSINYVKRFVFPSVHPPEIVLYSSTQSLHSYNLTIIKMELSLC